ncbi:MAG TPA: beta-ketoacyl-[acyl-carrier-protein] synthase family protein [Verrucomicrobiae bacterium]|nr:beta-ketoacyl-[acyl-carrier-protein] synthase family protein [Verrucomicrobiae bacterium]
MREPAVAIAGCGAISAAGRGVNFLRDALRANISGLRACERFDSPRFQSKMVGAIPQVEKVGENDNPVWQLATTALTEARDSARDILKKIPAERIGLALSTTKANIIALEMLAENHACSETAKRHLQGNLLATDLAAEFGARGPVQCVCVACISGLIALQQGAKMIQRGEADAVLVAGVDCLSAFVMAGFTALKALDPNGCQPFDRNRCGLSPGEAGAAIVLIRGDLISDSKIILRGWGMSNDANHLTGPSRDGSGLAQAIRIALDSAQLSPRQIDYVNAHGTGTPYNDAMESLALQKIFSDACPPFSGAKGMLGHTLGAAGVLETILCVLALREKFLPGTPRLSSVADGVPASIVREPRLEVKLKNVLKLNTGFGGVNGAIILSHE